MQAKVEAEFRIAALEAVHDEEIAALRAEERRWLVKQHSQTVEVCRAKESEFLAKALQDKPGEADRGTEMNSLVSLLEEVCTAALALSINLTFILTHRILTLCTKSNPD